MAKVRLVLDRRNIDRLATSPEAVVDVRRRVEAMAAACNSQSSWGGYESEVDVDGRGVVGRVWSIDEASDEARAQRLVRNLDAGRR